VSQEVRTVLRLLERQGRRPLLVHHVPRRGLAEQRGFLLELSDAPYVLYLDDDVLLEPTAVSRMLRHLRREGCGFVGMSLPGLSYLDDVRPHQQAVEWWDGPVEPERVMPGSPEWDRHRLHNAANVIHVADGLGLTPESDRLYRIAWVGGCVMYDAEALRSVGGFDFWRNLPAEHCGEDVLAQLRVMERYGAAGVAPTGAYHLELPTTIPNREVDAPKVLR
jgi:hypothetical protein